MVKYLGIVGVLDSSILVRYRVNVMAAPKTGRSQKYLYVNCKSILYLEVIETVATYLRILA